MKKHTLTADLPTPNPLFLKKYACYTRWDEDIDVFHLWHSWEKTKAENPDKEVIVFEDKSYTYAQVDAEIDIMARRFTKLGMGKNSHIGICMTNSPWYIISYYAALKIGAIVVNYNPLYVEKELKHQITDSKTQMMVSIDMDVFTDKLIPLMGTAEFKQLIVCPNSAGTSTLTTSDTIHTFASLGDDLPPIPNVELHHDDLAVLQYTGGTTGPSKGAALTHSNLSANLSQLCHWKKDEVSSGYEDRMATFLPLFHIYCMQVCMNLTVHRGGCMVVAPRFQIDDAIDLVEKHNVTIFPAVPTMIQAFTQMPLEKRKKLASVRSFTSGGAPLPEEVKKLFESQTGVEVIEGYGLSEGGPVIAENPRVGGTLPLSIGVPLPQTFISMRDLEDPEKEVPHGDRGEMCIKGPQVMNGYWNNDVANEKSFTKDGYFRTGDVGVFDDDGWTFLVDRIKDLIICGGYNVYPRNIEEALLTHPDIVEVIVIGIPDDYRGEKPKAFVRLEEGLKNPPTEDDIVAFAKDLLSPIERPKDIEFRTELPKTHVGKLSKKHLREELEN